VKREGKRVVVVGEWKKGEERGRNKKAIEEREKKERGGFEISGQGGKTKR
jgi:hypothetical protein